MNLCDVYIEKIISVETHDNYVVATLDTDCWGHNKKLVEARLVSGASYE